MHKEKSYGRDTTIQELPEDTPSGMMICKSTQENHHRRENELWHLEK